MDDILSKEADHNNIRALEHLKYDLNSANFEDEHMEEDDDDDEESKYIPISIEHHSIKRELNHDSSLDFSNDIVNIKQEDILDLESDIILPQASQSQNSNPPKHKKESKSKRELEEEERGKNAGTSFQFYRGSVGQV
ncbi:hypothetical protein NQ318_005927 [Aromia moschata]|uniref:Uncharacterized protein n=1 Tax=Aromia moschata TaxID=1265417 RepID=A0AAV8XM48_9CUCU|nr:hypothetical protein NQ318_005927 [Aromia moschata]